ncbi:unnamed protein product [Victoria cruziana]
MISMQGKMGDLSQGSDRQCSGG